jgi:hypothetical protein
MVEYTVANKLPVVNFPVPKSWAGNIPVGAPFGNDTLFFQLWEAENNDAKEHLISQKFSLTSSSKTQC